MGYFAVFIAGSAVATGTLLILYLVFMVAQQKTSRELMARRQQLDSETAAFRQQSQSFSIEHHKFQEFVKSELEDIDTKRTSLSELVAVFEGRKLKYDDMVHENNGLKQDLFNLSVQLKKTARDQAALDDRQEELSHQSNCLARRYLNENIAWIAKNLNSRNFASSKKRLTDVIAACRGIGFAISDEEESAFVAKLKRDFEEAVRQEFAREEQMRIKAQVREEERLARECAKQIQDSEREEAAIQAALDKALAEAKDQHTAEIERLEAKLKEAHEKSERAKSQAQLTKAGHVYVLSNIGCFGESVYKIGMTRRLEPMDRVKELSDASVPFTFDVHMMISCNDAPSLENTLHREFHKQRVNKVNLRKEFFRVDLEAILQVVEAQHGQVDFVASPAAEEYYQSRDMSEEDYEFIESTIQPLLDADKATESD